jgi:Spy/CpxP family protein refolding chaperone
MNRVLALLFVVAMALTLSVAMAEQDGGGKKEKAKKVHKEKAPKAVKVRLWAPFSKVEDLNLSDEQKTQIAALHKETLAKIKALQQQEHDAVMALLTPEQKDKVTEAMAKAKKPEGKKGKGKAKPKKDKGKKKGGDAADGDDAM